MFLSFFFSSAEPPEPTIPTVLSNSFDLTKKIKEGEKILLGCEANIDDTILLQLVLVTKNDVQSLIGPSADGYKLTENSEEVFGSCFRTAQAMYEKSFTVADDMTSVKCVSHYTDKNNPCPPHNQFCIDLGQIRVEAGPKKDGKANYS
ncbi:hypothetical protein EGW08_011319 [Elysia chlorotica]|uniref:Uncharacterized protein n=1 Tax=Elysia chlorotica TaxID=188477 RepID=A0A433TH24_ELYCH|nr:hypothetical protein EGW08_011319 [Elysia chlorotica]